MSREGGGGVNTCIRRAECVPIERKLTKKLVLVKSLGVIVDWADARLAVIAWSGPSSSSSSFGS